MKGHQADHFLNYVVFLKQRDLFGTLAHLVEHYHQPFDEMGLNYTDFSIYQNIDHLFSIEVAPFF